MSGAGSVSLATQRLRAAVLFAGLLMLALVISSLVVIVYIALQINDNVAQNEARSQQTRRIVVAVGICARTVEKPEDIERCVADLLDGPPPIVNQTG